MIDIYTDLLCSMRLLPLIKTKQKGHNLNIKHKSPSLDNINKHETVGVKRLRSATLQDYAMQLWHFVFNLCLWIKKYMDGE